MKPIDSVAGSLAGSVTVTKNSQYAMDSQGTVRMSQPFILSPTRTGPRGEPLADAGNTMAGVIESPFHRAL